VLNQTQNAGTQGQRVPIVGPYFLVSFDASSGIGVYEYLDVTHRFDALPGAPDRTGKKLYAGSQTDAGIYFNSLDELLSVCRREYLRDKKNTCYSTLFTTQPAKAVCARMLQFLDEPRLSGIATSRIVVSILREVADATLVAAVIALAHKMQLQNVQECLATEFHDIVFAQATTEHLKVTSAAADLITVKLREHRERKANPPLSPTASERR
jgi:hypothetical protein